MFPTTHPLPFSVPACKDAVIKYWDPSKCPPMVNWLSQSSSLKELSRSECANVERHP